MRTRHAFIVQLSVASNTQSGNLIKNNKKKGSQKGFWFWVWGVQTAHTHSSRRRSGKETLLDVGRISTLCTLIIIGTLDKDLVVLLFLKDMVVNYLNIILLCPPPHGYGLCEACSQNLRHWHRVWACGQLLSLSLSRSSLGMWPEPQLKAL